MELPEPAARNALLLLGYLLERERHPELGLPEIPAISKVVGLTHHDTGDLIDILDSEGAIEANPTFGGGAAPKLTGRGKLMLERLSESSREEDAQVHPPPDSETSPEPQEFVPSPDYRRVDWRGKRFRFSPMQSHVVRLLHEEFKRGGGELGDVWLLERSGSTGKYLRDIFRRHCAWGTLIIAGESKGTHKLSLLP